jgi:hypothetical protein
MDQLLAWLPPLCRPMYVSAAPNQFFFQDLNCYGNVNDYYDRQQLSERGAASGARHSDHAGGVVAGWQPAQLNARGEFPGTMVKVNLPIQVVIDPFNGRSHRAEEPRAGWSPTVSGPA